MNEIQTARKSNKQVFLFMANFVPLSVEHLEEKAFESASILNNDPMLLAAFFHHAKLAL